MHAYNQAHTSVLSGIHTVRQTYTYRRNHTQAAITSGLHTYIHT